MRNLVVLLAAFAILFSGCASQQATLSSGQPSELCKAACGKALAAKQNLNSGPCLLDPIPQQPGWVCDVAHQPRQAIDNLPENQCQAFRRGEAKAFVEVDAANCSVINIYS